MKKPNKMPLNEAVAQFPNMVKRNSERNKVNPEPLYPTVKHKPYGNAGPVNKPAKGKY